MSKKQNKRIVTKKTRRALNRAVDFVKNASRSFMKYHYGAGAGQRNIREHVRYVDAD